MPARNALAACAGDLIRINAAARTPDDHGSQKG
jgi:hypothetical protein